MTNIVFKPQINRVNQELNRVFGEVFNRPVQELLNDKKSNHFPAYANIEEKNDRFIISLSVPGFDKENISIHLHENKLLISGKKENPEERKYQLREFDNTSFERVFLLPEDIQKDKIEATSENGILTITVYKSEKKAPITIQVK
jgi:HSP20 family protein